MKNFNDNWEYCSHCDCAMIVCPDCKNNSCNAGYGKVNGEICKTCPEVYDFQEKAFKCEKVPCVTTLRGWITRNPQGFVWDETVEKL